MVEAKSGIGPVTRFDTTGWACRIAGEVRDLDPDARLGPRALRRLGVFMVYALVAGDEAMADAGYDVAATVAAGAPVGSWPDPLLFGVYVGSGIGGFPEIVEATGLMNREGIRSISPLFIPRSLINLATGQLAIRYHARGPSLCLSTACAVGNHSIGEAWRAIRDGDADVILAGGTEGSLTALSYGGFMNM